MLLSVIMPAFNEQNTIEEIVSRVFAVSIPEITVELVIVDDGSTDSTGEIANRLAGSNTMIRVFKLDINSGKGAALSRGFKEAKGDFVIIQDADLEYDPQEFPTILEPLLSGKADVVYGSRFLTTKSHRVFHFWHSIGNIILTFLSNMMTDLNFTDMETCYKAFKADVIKQISIREKRFGVEPEITAKIAKIRPTLKIFEVGISYAGRSYEEGKKIGVKDGIWALWCVFKYRFFN